MSATLAGVSVGDAVATLTYDGFAEWALTPAKLALQVPRATADMVPLLTSGLTASIGECMAVCITGGMSLEYVVTLRRGCMHWLGPRPTWCAC